MADEAKTLIFSLDFDTDEALKRAANLRSAIDADKEALAELNKVIKKNGEANQQQLVEREKLEKSIRNNNKARSEEIRGLDSYLKATKANSGSLKEMRSEVIFLTDKYTSLTKAERENAEIGGKLQAEIKKLNDELKKSEGAYGDNRRSVGGYTEGIKAAVEQSGLLGGFTAQLRDAQGKLTGVLNIARASIVGNVSALKLLKFALAATGIGAVVLLLGGLVSWLTKTQEGIDFVDRKTKGLSVVLGVLTDKLSAVGKTAFEAFSSPKTAIQALVDFLKDQLINRLKAVAIIFDALAKRDFNKLQDGIAQFTLGITDATAKAKALVGELGNAAKAGEAIAKENQRIRDAERALNQERANSRKLVKELNMIAEDTSKSTAKRLAAGEKAMKIEQALMARQVALQKARVKNLENEQALTNNLTADNDKLAEERIKLDAIQAESLELQTTLQNKINTIRQGAAAEAERLFNEQRARMKAEADALDAHYKATQERLKKEQEEIQKTRDAYVAAANEKMKKAAGFTREQLNLAKLEQEEQKRLSDLKIKQKEDEFQAIAAITSGLSNLVGALANQDSEFAVFQKALTSVQIAMSTAEAISKGIAASQGLPFPANLVAIAPTIGAILSNMAQATALIQQDIPKAPQVKRFATGGLLDGPSHNEGGIKGTGSFAGIEVEGGEAIISKRATELFTPLLSAINIAGGGKPLAPTRYAAMGGFIPGGMGASGSSSVIDYDKLANKLANAIERMPAPVVSVTALSESTLKRDNRQKSVTLGR